MAGRVRSRKGPKNDVTGTPALAHGRCSGSLVSLRLSASVHNVVHFALALMGVAMLAVALFDWLIHPVSLWASLW